MKKILAKLDDKEIMICILLPGYSRELWYSKMLSSAPKGKKAQFINILDRLKNTEAKDLIRKEVVKNLGGSNCDQDIYLFELI